MAQSAENFNRLLSWQRWLADDSEAQCLQALEMRWLKRSLKYHFGKNALLLGVNAQQSFLQHVNQHCHFVVNPFSSRSYSDDVLSISGNFYQLPITSMSMDMVVIPHTLEFVDQPQQLIDEAMRVVKPEGLIVVFAFNPHGWFALKRQFTLSKLLRETRGYGLANFLSSQSIVKWLNDAEFIIEHLDKVFYTIPNKKNCRTVPSDWLESLGRLCFSPLGGSNIIVGRAKVIPLNPLNLDYAENTPVITIPPALNRP